MPEIIEDILTYPEDEVCSDHFDLDQYDHHYDIRKNVIYILTPQNLKYIYRIACINQNHMRKDQ